MPRTPTTLFIVPSRLAMVCHLLLAMGVVALVFGYAGHLLGLIAALLMGVLLVVVGANRPRGELRVIHRGSGQGSGLGDGRGSGLGYDRGYGQYDWSWRESPESAWRSVRLECDYLGPWLVGLKLDGRRLWLWPDSSDRDALRVLRREMVSLS